MATPTLLHVDMDAFFASVEQLDNPALRGRCVVVGGTHRGVVAAASYEARRFGIHSAMPIFQAKRKCPRLVIVSPRRARYAQLSRRIMELLRTFTPLVEPVSIDEAYLDITGCGRLHGPVLETARAIKARIRESTGLTCSVGAAPNKFLAKIASEMDKPDGLTVIAPEQVQDFIRDLPIEKVPGVGQRAREQLAALGVERLGQVAGLPASLLVRRLGVYGHRLLALSQGRDETPVKAESEPKSVSSETTLERNTAERSVLAARLLAQSETVARQLRQHRVGARTITLILKTGDFKRHSRSRTLDRAVRSSEDIYRIAVALLDAFALTQPVRLVGVGAGGLQPDSLPVQQPLFGEPETPTPRRWEVLDRAIDAISAKYGRQAVGRGTLNRLKEGSQRAAQRQVEKRTERFSPTGDAGGRAGNAAGKKGRTGSDTGPDQ
ncbi:DNA polymerase IV [Desulfatitalea alkaliphila]|uniref:DNA polymerase IV n=1 Tax=Desulfatitalea alkaliphila TaxID=2929485 RepID=A0AA41UHX9_9BACT|nr:DNA polymerase IV [Desulfatitalea alkaliphila]MCJ8499077.1 DNA polymerase IV [Desulfatitalea alkaliphila]